MDSTENRIIQAAIECVEKYGIRGATNRRISEVGEVNIAAINYYFRSKENLIERVMETTINNAFDWQQINAHPECSAKELCVVIFSDLIKGGCQYPGISRAHFYELITEGNYDSLVVKHYNEFMAKLIDELLNRGTSLKKEELKMACSQIAAACFMAALAPQLNKPGLAIDFNDDETRSTFVNRLVEKLL